MAEFINIISSYIMPVVKSGEQFYANLLFIYDIITRFVFVPAAGDKQVVRQIDFKLTDLSRTHFL